jgi:hypothetical protein
MTCADESPGQCDIDALPSLGGRQHSRSDPVGEIPGRDDLEDKRSIDAVVRDLNAGAPRRDDIPGIHDDAAHEMADQDG